MLTKKIGNENGAVLMLVIIFSFILSGIGLSTLYLHSSEELTARKSIDRTRAFNMAEAGLERAKSWLKNAGQYPESMRDSQTGNLLFPSITSGFNPFGGTVTFEPQPASAPGTYTVTILPDVNNSSRWDKTYVITSVGDAGNNEKALKCTVQLSSLLRYVYFSEVDCEKIYNPLTLAKYDKTYFTKSDHLTGLIHSNSIVNVAGTPVFTKTYLDGVHYDITTASSFFFFTTNSDPSYASPVTRKSMFENLDPSGFDRLRTVAANQGVNLYSNNSDKTIVINGNSITINGGSAITIPPQGLVVFVENGNIDLRQSTDLTPLNGWLTIVSSATNVSGKGNITIKSSLTYARDSNSIPLSLLGLVASNQISLNVPDPNDGTKLKQSVEVDALMMTNNCLHLNNYDDQGSGGSGSHPPASGTFTLLGGIIQRFRDPVGLATTSGSQTMGYSKLYSYDGQLYAKVPPFFPNMALITPTQWTEDPMARIP